MGRWDITTRLLSHAVPNVHENVKAPAVLVAVVTSAEGAAGMVGKVTLAPLNSKSVKTASWVTVLKGDWAMPTWSGPVRSLRTKTPPGRSLVICAQESDRLVFQ